MSDTELAHIEGTTSNEDLNLVAKQEKQKHASYSEKDDAKLLSDGTSDDGDEEDLVLEYSDSVQVSGQLEETVDFEKGDSVSASDEEIAGLTGENCEYTGAHSKVEKLLSIESDEVDDDNVVKERQENVAKEEDISRIAETLSSQMVLESEVDAPDVLSPPRKPITAVDDDDDDGGGKNEKRKEAQRKLSSSSLSDSGRFSASKKDDRASSNHSSNEELEWDEEYEFGSKSEKRLNSENAGLEKVARAVKQVSVKGKEQDIKKEEKKRSERPAVISNDDDVKSIASKSRLSKPASVGHSKDTKSGKHKRERAALNKAENVPSKTTGQDKEAGKKPSGGKSKRIGKRTRYKVYLDDPDIHQSIADFSSLLRKLKKEVEKGEYVPKSGSKLHPQSRDDILEEPHKRRGGKKYAPVKSTSMDQPHGSKTFQPIQQSTSDGHLGPYDGHGKRGRNLIARIKGLSESSSSPDDDDDYDDDERTNAGMFKSKTKKRNSAVENRKEDKQYDLCSECGQLHSADEDTNEESDQEICPDCGVPHNPFKHPPSPSSKTKWRLYVEHCRKAMLHLSNQTYHQLPQDPPEPAREELLPSIEGPHAIEELKVGARYKMKYLGTTQVTTQHPVTKETRMEQAQQAYARIKVPEGEVQPDTDVEMIISLERIKVVNFEGKHEDIMMDHALRTVCFICDMGDILVLMSRRLTTDLPDVNLDQDTSKSLSNILAEREKRTSKNICHIYQSEEAQTVSKAIGQAFNMAYRQFLKSNGISHDSVEEAEYCHVLESQKIVGQDLDLLADSNNTRDIVIQKKRGEALGVMLLESGWGSMLPTVFVAHIANYSPAARLGGQLSVGDHILACNGASLVGLPLSECNQVLRNTRSSARVMLRIVSCPPVVDVVVSRPDVKFQLGFSVQNGTICSLLRGGIAERGGVRVGHRIIEINGESVVAKSHQHIVDILANTSGEIGMKTLPVAMYRLMVGIDTPTHV